MNWWEMVLCIFCIVFCYYSYIRSYQIIYKEKNHNYNYKMIPVFLILLLIMFYNTFFNYNFTKILISFINLMIVFKFSFNSASKDIFLKGILIYFLGWIIEIVTGGLVFYTFFNSVKQFDSNIVLKVLFSLLTMLIFILVSNVKIVPIILNNIYNNMKKVVNVTISMILFIIVIVILSFYLIISSDVISYISIFTLVFIMAFLFIMFISQVIKTKRLDEKQESLLKFMKEYEKIIDKERMDRHEIVNNLLVLKSIKNKDTKEYEKIIEELLVTYKSDNSCRILYKLPPGLKGMLYYKIYEMKSKSINVFVNISNASIKFLDQVNTKEIAKLCKIIGILLDNAKEAAEESKEKSVIIDVYKEKENVIIYIENSIKDDIEDIKKLSLKGYSTKGSDRGYGLYIVTKELETLKNICFEQKIQQKKFITTLKITK